MIHSEIKISKSGNRLILEIPQGMTGSQLVRWKKKNAALIESAKESADGLVAVVTYTEAFELPTETPVSSPVENSEMFHEEHLTDAQALKYFNSIVESASPCDMDTFKTYCKGNTKADIQAGADDYFETNILG
jgi:hypothetical protein